MTIEAVGLIVTNLIVIFGWFVVFRQALHVKYRDDLRKVVDLSTATVDDIYDLTRAYYDPGNREHISHDSTNLRAKFVLLSHYLIMLKSAGLTGEISAALTQYKIHSTGGFFETVDFQNQRLVPNWQSLLSSAAQELRFRVEKSYFDNSRNRYSRII